MGGKSKSVTVSHHWLLMFHAGLCRGPIDALLEFRGGDKTAWQGEITSSATFHVDAPGLWGGEKDQGGIVSEIDVMFGEADQEPNPYLLEVLGNQVPGWRGLTTLVFKGGRYGAGNPYPHPAAFKIRKILKGWEGDWGDDPCWYPAKAEVPVADSYASPPDADGWGYVVIPWHANPGFEQLTPPAGEWDLAQAPFAGGNYSNVGNTDWPVGTIMWCRRTVKVPPSGAYRVVVGAENGCLIWVNGVLVGASNRDNENIPGNHNNPVSFPLSAAGEYDILVKAWDRTSQSGGGTALLLQVVSDGAVGINPAHALYYCRTDSEKGREPYEGINDASLRAAADRLHSEGFGLCVKYNPEQDTPDEWEARICRIIGGSFTRDLTDGQWYLDLARGDYDLEALPVLNDDHILSFKELPTTLDRAVNSISVRYFDVERKETVVTPPVRALGLIRRFGENHQVLDFPEIPNGGLAVMVADRELRASTTPTRAWELSTTPITSDWRPNTYFRLQSPKRGISDLVCLVGEKEGGKLRSGAVSLKVTQDIYRQPTEAIVQVELGVDTRPDQLARRITHQRAFEAPYIDIVGVLPRAELEALPEDVGFLEAVAVDPGQSLDYTMMVRPDGGEFDQVGSGEWCPTAVIVEGDDRLEGAPATEFTLQAGRRLSEVAVGSVALWGEEFCRVDAINFATMTLELGRGCADTPPLPHAAGERIWFIGGFAAADPTEYAEGEEVEVRLLTNTGSQQLPIDQAVGLPVEFRGRQARPYPPANVQINGEYIPAAPVSGEFTLTLAHRDRLLQADQLVDWFMPGVGPEPGVEYIARFFAAGTDTELHVVQFSDDEVGIELPTLGSIRMELSSVRADLESLFPVVIPFDYGTTEVVYLVFTEDGTFDPPPGVTVVDVLLVAGGGGGSRGGTATNGGTGGGAGGVRELLGVPVSGPVSIVVGKGGVGGIDAGALSRGQDGTNSAFGSEEAIAGTGGAYINYSSGLGGSGGGAISASPAGFGAGTPGQGHPGGTSSGIAAGGSGGGGGAGGPGGDGTQTHAGDGGPGVDLASIGWGDAIAEGAPSEIAGGGAAGRSAGVSAPGAASHGAGAGGHNAPGQNAAPNTGAGGGGGGTGPSEGGDGADGLVIVRLVIESGPGPSTSSMWVGHAE